MRLTVEGLAVRFGPTVALSDVSLTVAAGERVGLIGPNGAGKTTLLDAIGGFVTPAAGRVRLDGASIVGRAPDTIARAGVGRVFQTPRLSTRLTVAANVRAGRPLDPRPWLSHVGLDARADDLAGGLTPAEARRMELARALAGDPRLLLLDEPFGGLTGAETAAMTALVERGSAGRTTILVEHKLGIVTRLCPRVVVLHLGATIFDGPATALRDDPAVLAAYLGAD